MDYYINIKGFLTKVRCMRCPKCGMVFENRSAICPRCGSDIGANNAALALLNRTLFRVAGCSINFLQLYAIVSVNAIVLCSVFNAALYNGVIWVLPVAAGLAAGYFAIRMLGAGRRKILLNFRRLFVALIVLTIFLQIFVTGGFWATEWFYSAAVLCGYIVTISVSVITKRTVNQPYVTLFLFTLIGIVPFILQNTAYCSESIEAYYFCFAQFIVSMLFFLNTMLVLVFRLRKAIGSILE